MTTQLTTRQQEVLDLWLAGTTYKELASTLGISPETVNPHLKQIAKKLGATGISRGALSAALPTKVGTSGPPVASGVSAPSSE